MRAASELRLRAAAPNWVQALVSHKVSALEILQVLMDPILPVFAIMAFGFGMGRAGKSSVDDARLLNRFAMSVLLPIYVFGLIANSSIQSFSLAPILVYLLVQIIIFSCGFMMAHRLFRRTRKESLLLGFCGVFGNNALYVLPMSVLLYGETNVLPITSIVTLDAIVAFGGAMLALQIISLGKVSPGSIALGIAKVPMLQAIVVGLVFNLAGFSVPAPVNTFVGFSGAGAAPVALYALGVVLSQTRFRPDKVVMTFTLLKLIMFPASMWLGLTLSVGTDNVSNQFMLAAAAPAGAMSFSLAMLYDVRTDDIAQVIIITCVLSLITLAAFA